MGLDPSSWIAEAIIDEIEAVAAKYRTAAAAYRAEEDQHGVRSAEQLEAAADTCVEIIDMIRRNHLTATGG